MSWNGHRIYAGAMGGGKTVRAIADMRAARQPAIFYDPALDAMVPRAVEAGPDSDARAIARELRAGGTIVYRGSGLAYARAEAAFLCRLCRDRGDCQLVIDEAHRVAGQGRVVRDLADLWDTGRHRGVTISLVTTVPQDLDHHLRTTAAAVYIFPMAWAAWLGLLGANQHDLNRLHSAAPHSYLYLAKGRCTGPHAPQT